MNADLQAEPNAMRTFENGLALVIAVANYNEINPLPNSVLNDARDVATVLTSQALCGYDPKAVSILLDGVATLTRIREALTELANVAGPNDTVIVFFSGHGARVVNASGETSALLPVDCALTDVAGTSISEAEFSKALADIKSRRVLVLLDACHAGGAATFKSKAAEEISLGYTEKSLEKLAKGTGKVLIASSRASETSLVLDGAKNSVFTQHLLEALRGDGRTNGDGLIRIFEIFNHVSQKVRQSVPGKQHPIFKASDLEDNFPVVPDRGGRKSFPASVFTPSSHDSDQWQRLGGVLTDLYPTGPTDQEIWSRAGGDLSRIRLGSTGRADWFAALRTLRQGGGGVSITRHSLIRAALSDFPHHSELTPLL
jgi:metacaspase-1